MGGDMTLMAVAMMVGAFILAAALVAVICVVSRALTGNERSADGGNPARALLDRRLAAGEISVEEHGERAGALGAQPSAP